MATDPPRATHLPPLVTFATLTALLAVSVVLDDVTTAPAARVAILALAALKVALVASEYVEVRGSARWLVTVWTVWGCATFTGLALHGAAITSQLPG